MGLAVLLLESEREELLVLLHRLVVPVPADEALGIKDCVLGVARQLVLGRITDEPLALLRKGCVKETNG